MRVIFLDVDGVLNVVASSSSSTGRVEKKLDEKLCGNLIDVISKTNARIVLTSTWREHPKLCQFLVETLFELGLDKGSFLGCTTSKVSRSVARRSLTRSTNSFRVFEEELQRQARIRSLQILEYLKENKRKITSWCAIDDLDLESAKPKLFADHFVRTDNRQGLCETFALEKIVNILTRK